MTVATPPTLITSIIIDGGFTMPMHNPPHPGLTMRHDCLEPLGLTVTEGARVLGVTRQALNNLVNGKAGISPEMAVRLSKAFGATPGRGCGCKWPTTSPRCGRRKSASSVCPAVP
jgi:antitoxin HigA-1